MFSGRSRGGPLVNYISIYTVNQRSMRSFDNGDATQGLVCYVDRMYDEFSLRLFSSGRLQGRLRLSYRNDTMEFRHYLVVDLE